MARLNGQREGEMRQDLQRVLDEVDALDRAADALVTPLSDEQFHWRPDEGRAWGVAECLDHLATTNVLYGTALEKAVEEARQRGLVGGGPIAPTFFGERFIRSMEPPVKLRTRAPASVKPRAGGSRQEIVAAYFASHDRFRDLVRRCEQVDVNRAKFPNPFFRLLTVRVGTGLRIITAHDRRHLWQAGEAVKKLAARP
jgi:hypothetical protein